jgi:hypothetical protein
MNVILWIVVGAAIASACWWIYVRGLHGTISDLNDAVNDAKKAAGK